MSVNEERMLILKMLEEGKITSDEAARLLEALDGSSKQTAGEKEQANRQQRQTVNFADEASKVRDRINEWKKEFQKSHNPNDFDNMVEEFSSKAEKLGKSVAATTFNIVDKAIDFVGSFVDTNVFNIFGSLTLVEKSFETAAAEGMDIFIEGVNGQILVKKHMEDKVLIKSRVRSPQNNADEVLKFDAEDGRTISLKLGKTGNISVSHEVFLPAFKFNKISLKTSNGKIFVEDSLSLEFESITKNSPIDLMGVNSDSIFVSTRNARVDIGYAIGRNVTINTSNSLVNVKNVKAENIKAVTTNGKIFIENVQGYKNSPEINMFLRTSNAGGIKVNMNDMDKRGYKIKSRTTNGSINLLIPEMVYHNINKQGTGSSFVEAESNGYAGYAEKVNINAETSNGDIEIVK